MSYDGHTISVLPGPPCGLSVYEPGRKKIAVLTPGGWKTNTQNVLGFCELQEGHSGPCTHLMSKYPR